MKIEFTGNSLFTGHVGRQNNAAGQTRESTAEKWLQAPVQMRISKEGMQGYRESLEEQTQYFERILEERERLITEGGDKRIFQPVSYAFCAELQKNGRYLSIEDTARNFLKAYATVYDDIVQKHRRGEESYISDPSAEDGCRKLTMEEELGMLDTALKNSTEFLETQIAKMPEFVKLMEDHYQKLRQVGAKVSHRLENALDWYAKRMEELKHLPDNIGGLIIKASKCFAQQYNKQNKPGMSVEDILAGVSFSLSKDA